MTVHVGGRIKQGVLRVLHRGCSCGGDVGGVSDETAMIGLMLVVAVTVGGIILALTTGAAGKLDFGF